MPFEQPQFKAGGNISPATFVTLNPTGGTQADFAVFAATDGSSSHGDICVGVATQAKRAAPIPGSSDLAGSAGDEMRVHGIGEVCLLVNYDATLKCGDLIKSDASARGVKASSSGDIACAMALEAPGATGELIRVLVISPYKI